MKEYKKPAMMALSLSANDMLCGDCNVKTRFTDDPFIKKWTEDFGAGGNVPGVLDPGDNVFGAGEDCSIELDTYCKYGPTGQIIFTS